MCKCRLLCKIAMNVEYKFFLHLLALMALTFLVVLPVCSRKLKFSLYHSLWSRNIEDDQKQMREQNDARIKYAKRFLESGGIKRIQYGVKKNVADVGISIITVSRNRHVLDSYEPRYLTQVVSRFAELLSATSSLRFSYKLFICDVDEDPASYFEMQQLSKHFEIIHRFPLRNSTQQINIHYKTLDETLEKEKQDYIFCGRETLKRNISNVFLVEDDALPHDDVIDVLEYILQYHIMDSFRPGTLKNVSYYKFYHPDRLLGYISLEVERLPELFALSIVSATILTLIYIKARQNICFYKETIWFCLFVYFCLLFIVLGRQSFLDFRRLSSYLYQVTPAPTCCTPAMLYTKVGFTAIANYLQGVLCKANFGKDTAMDTFRFNSGLKAQMIQPNLFTHIGMYSSLRDKVLDPFIV